MTRLNLSRMHFPVTALGPGMRIGIWFQGCSLRCPGCISADTWALGKGTTTAEAVYDQLLAWLGEADGITVSGGEPFDQDSALIALLRKIRPYFGGDVLVYTGYELDELGQSLPETSGLIDALITGRYRHDAPQS